MTSKIRKRKRGGNYAAMFEFSKYEASRHTSEPFSTFFKRNSRDEINRGLINVVANYEVKIPCKAHLHRRRRKEM